MIVSEEIHLPINIDLLRDELILATSKKPMISRSPAIGGWALQSTNNSYTDGWDTEFTPYNGPHNLGPQYVPTNDKQKKLRAVQDYVQPTEIQTPYLTEFFQILTAHELNPRKARVIRLSANSGSVWHQDGVKHYYQVRLHIPLITNPHCFFETEQGRVHMEYGKIYLVHINRLHRVVNNSHDPRLHFVCHIWDRKPLSQFHIYELSKNAGQSYLPDTFL